MGVVFKNVNVTGGRTRIIQYGVGPSGFSNVASRNFNGSVIGSFNGLSFLTPGSAFGVSFWAKMPVSGSASVVLFQSPLTPNDGFVFFIRAGLGTAIANQLNFEFIVSIANIQYRDQIYTSGPSKRDGLWHHYYIGTDGYSYDITTVRLFVDGVDSTTLIRNEITATQGWATNGQSQTFGNLSGARSDELAFFDYNPGAATCYNAGVPFDLSTLATPPTDYFRFENNLTNLGSNGGSAASLSGTPSYSTDVP